MPKFRVSVPTIGMNRYIVEAKDEEAAKELVARGEAEYDDDSNTEEDLDSNNWIVDED